jgi:ATP-binding cassette subfamily B (MDR/TAP) protein 1
VGAIFFLTWGSGCGKSTLVQLCERFYDPIEGQVLLDGKPLTSYACYLNERVVAHAPTRLNIQWLRTRIALVSQMPILFPVSIRTNIAMGKKDATLEEIRAAAADVCLWSVLPNSPSIVQANAARFIEEFPDQYETYAGDGGASMSGGQRQRIALSVCLFQS